MTEKERAELIEAIIDDLLTLRDSSSAAVSTEDTM